MDPCSPSIHTFLSPPCYENDQEQYEQCDGGKWYGGKIPSEMEVELLQVYGVGWTGSYFDA